MLGIGSLTLKVRGAPPAARPATEGSDLDHKVRRHYYHLRTDLFSETQ